MPDTHSTAPRSLAVDGIVILGVGAAVGLGAVGAWVLLNPHSRARSLCLRIGVLREGDVPMRHRALRAIEEIRWRWWLRARVTARGAQVPRTRAPVPAHCPRCGDRMGSIHECRDLAR